MPSKQSIQAIDILDLYGNEQDKKKKSSGTKKQQELLISEDDIYRNPTSEKSVKPKNKTSRSKQKPQQKKSTGTQQQQELLFSEDDIYRNPTSDIPVKHNFYSSVYDGSWFIVLAAIGIPATIIGLMVTGTRRK